MPGALNTLADQPQTLPSMAYMAPNGSGALSMSPGPLASPMSGVDPTGILALMGAGAGPPSPYAQKLSDASNAVMGDPGDIAGALSASRKNYDASVQTKMSAIQRAMDLLTAAKQAQTVNLPLMAGAVGALQPTRTGSIGETIGNAFSAAMPQIEQQRAAERQLATSLGGMGVEQSDVGLRGALENQGDVEKRLSIAGQLANQAGQIQARSDLANARERTGILQYAGRIGAADIAANRNRYKFIGTDPNDPTIGRYLDQTTGDAVAGPAATGTTRSGGAAGTGGVAQWRYNMWLAAHPGDQAGALDYSAGHKTLSPEQQRASALSLAQRELGPGADKDDINSRAQEIYDTVKSGFGGSDTTALASTSPAPAPRGAISGGGVAPAAPTGVPPGAKYSPSQKKWWWQQNGKWQHN